jgi:hypothetical protein
MTPVAVFTTLRFLCDLKIGPINKLECFSQKDFLASVKKHSSLTDSLVSYKENTCCEYRNRSLHQNGVTLRQAPALLASIGLGLKATLETGTIAYLTTTSTMMKKMFFNID